MTGGSDAGGGEMTRRKAAGDAAARKKLKKKRVRIKHDREFSHKHGVHGPLDMETGAPQSTAAQWF